MVHCLDVDLTVPVLVTVRLLLHEVYLVLDVGGEAAEGFAEHQGLRANTCCGGLAERLSCYAEQ